MFHLFLFEYLIPKFKSDIYDLIDWDARTMRTLHTMCQNLRQHNLFAVVLFGPVYLGL